MTQVVEIARNSTTLSPKGQVVIVKDIREKLNLKPGTKFFEFVRDSEIILKPIKPVEEMFGFLKDSKGFKGKTAEDIAKEIDEGWD